MAGIWSPRDNPRQTFTVALQLALMNAPDAALFRLASGEERYTVVTKDDAKLMLKKRGFELDKGEITFPCDDCGTHVKTRKQWFSRFVCFDCYQVIQEQWSRNRLGRAGRKPKEASK